MNRASWLAVLTVMACSALFVSLSGTGAQAGFTSVWAVDDGEKIFRDNITSPLKNGNSVWNGSSVSLFGCRNEIVAFQLILQADGSGATNADVQISDLTSGGNTIRGSHPLLTANNYIGMGVELFTEHYQNVSVLSGDPNEGYFNWTASAAPYLSGMTTGWMPDALVPFSAASGKGGAPFTIAANKNQGVWVDIYIDKTLPTGTYTGTITIKLGGATHSTIPLSLQVLSPTLSDTNHYKSMIAYGPTGDVRQRHNLTCCGADMWQTIGDYNRMAHRHRIDLIGSGSRTELDYLPDLLTGEAYTATHNYEGPGEGVGNQVFSVGTYGAWWSQNQSYFQTESDYFENWFNANAPSVERFLYLVDEPGTDLYPDIRTKCNWIHNNPGPGKNLPVLITKHVDGALVGYVDIWCSPTGSWDSVTTAEAEARGEQVYTYAAHRPKTPADITDEWGIAYRLKPWISHQWDVTRWFTWESTHYTRNPNEINPGTQFDVWTDPLSFHTTHASETGNGDGVMFYPGRDYVFTAQDRNYNGPVSSIRMKMYRRGIQDVEYMWLAEQAGKTAQVNNIIQDLLPHTMDNAVTIPDWSNANAPYYSAQRELADLAAGTVRAPSARFQASVTRGPATLAVNFTDLSTFTPTAWAWTFGDGGTSASQNPSHSYSSVGAYTVSLIATNAQGQDSEVKLNYINVVQEVVVYPGALGGSASVVSGSLTDLQTDNQAYHVLQPTAADKKIDFQYTVDTAYTPAQVARIKLEYQAKRSSSTTPSGGLVFVRKSDLAYQFLGGWLMNTTDTDWIWETTSVSTYMTSGGELGYEFCGCPNGTTNYTISNDVMRWRLELAQSGAIAPIAEFVGAPRSGSAPLAVQFTDCSSNTPTAWSWTFGDGGSSASRNPSHTYSSGGNYNVSLTATNSAGNDTETKNSYITVSGTGNPPVANFSGSPTSGAAPLAVTFTDSSTNTPTAWSWNFGDSNTSTLQNPSHTYAVGTYTVSLTATNAYGSDGETKTNYITATVAPPVANFTGTPTTGTAPLAVTFTDTSTNTPTSWSWNFGDSSTSTLQNPSHTYAAGTYTVTLTATNAGGSDGETKTNYITATPPAPVANFTGSPTSGTAPLTVNFTDTSTNTPTAWSWDFGDSGTSTVQNPSHQYVSAGNYTVTLTATNAGGSDGETKTNYISVQASGAPTFVAAGAIASNAAAITPALPAGIATNDILLLFLETANQAVSISNQNGGAWTAVTNSPQGTGTAGGSSATRLTAYWSRYNGTQGAPTTSDSGNHQLGRIIAIRGAATSGDPWDVTAGGVESTADTSGSIPGATTTVANTLVVAAIATALPDASGTANFSAWTNANLVGLTERTDNTVTAGNGGGLGIASGERSAAGAYGNTTVTCGSSAAKGLLSIALKPAAPPSPPVANFTGTPTSGTAPLAVTFTDTSTNTPTSWSWNFGDSTTSTLQNPSHSYAAGTYTVTLTATNSAGSDGETKTNYITATVAPPVANFTGNPTTGTAPLAVAFTDTSTNTPTSWSWAFGDSSTSTVQNPSHTYAAGTYTVTLTATNAGGSDGETKTNYITATVAPPVANFTGNPTSGTAPLSVNFTDTSTNTPTAWSWTFGDSSTSTVQNPSHSYAAGTYTVSLTATNAGGSDGETKTNYITASAGGSPPVANFSGTPVNGQVSLAVSFTDTSTNTPTAWSWSFGDSGTSTVQNPSHTYTTAGDYTVSLTATNAAGSDGETKTNYVTVSAANEVIVYPDTWSINWYTPGCTLQSGGLSDLTTDNDQYMVIRSDTSTQRYGIMYTADTAYTPSQVSKITIEYQAKVSRSDTPSGGVTFVRKSDGVWQDTGDYWKMGTTDTNWSWNSTSVATYMDSSGVIGFEWCGCPTGGNTNNYDVSSDRMRFRLQLVAVQPPVANFSGTPTSGAAPLAVSFTDTSTNSPTSWSWNFGDSGTSTLQNPSHTYNSAGNYTVSLTATNSAGSDGETKTNYISVTANEVYVYPISWTSWAGVSLLSGALADLQTDNNVYMVYRCNTSNQQFEVEYQWDTTYTPSQLSKITVQLQWKGSRADTPGYGLLLWNYSTSSWTGLRERTLWYTTDTDFTWETTSVSTYMNAAGEMRLTYCGCPVGSNNYDTSIDVTRMKFTLN